MLTELHTAIARTDAAERAMSDTLHSLDIAMQPVFANHLVLLTAGLVETATTRILSEYAMKVGDARVARFTTQTVKNNNSLNCQKIRGLLDRFDLDWWRKIEGNTDVQDRSAIDSIKTLRDQAAHGNPTGTGFNTVSGYYSNSKRFIRAMHEEILS